MSGRRPRVAASAVAGLVALTLAARWSARPDPAAVSREDARVVLADDGVQLHVELDGRDDAPVTVVLVHGYASSTHAWRHQRQALATRARLVLFDHRGHGRSGWGSPRRATLEQLGEDLRAVLRAHADDRPVVLVSHSMGGMAVLALAGSHPALFGTRVHGVALLSTSSGHLVRRGLSGRLASVLRRVRALEAFLWLLWLVAPVIDRLGPVATAPGRVLLRRRLFGTDGPTDHELGAARHDAETTRQSVLAAFAPSLLHHDRSVSVLRPLPVLVLAGEEDALISPSHSTRLRDELEANCRLVVVPGAGHMVNVTHADPVSDALLRLLEDVERAAAAGGGRGAVRPSRTTT